MSYYLIKGESLTALADSIRAKAGSTEKLVCPDGLKAAVDGIESGNSPEAELALKLWEERSKSTNLSNMFEDCPSLITVPLFDTSNVTNFSAMFYGCSSLTTVPLFDTSEAVYFSSMFYGCSSLTTVPLFDTSNVTNFGTMFHSCTALTTVPPFDTNKSTNFASMFYRCTALTECWLRNIKTNLQVGSGASYGHLLTVDSLIHLIYELRDTGSRKTLTMGSVNLAKLENVYVRTIDITDEMRAEDDLIDEKLPFEVCESTDEGAMLITDYVLEKNWTLA